MPVDESIVKAAEPLATWVVDAQTKRKVERAIANDGTVILDLDFIPLKSPDGSVWRGRIDNSGNFTWTKET